MGAEGWDLRSTEGKGLPARCFDRRRIEQAMRKPLKEGNELHCDSSSDGVFGKQASHTDR
jgi:hypothetical protein